MTFGNSVFGFRDFGSTFVTLVVGISGELNFSDFESGYYRNIGPVMLCTFTVLLVFVLLTMAIAIIESPMMNGGTLRVDAGQRFAPR